MTISVICPICRETLTCEFDGTLYGIIAIGDLHLMELTAPAEVSRHMDSHRALNEAGGYEMDPAYWARLRESLEAQQKSVEARLRSLNDAGLGKAAGS